MGTPIINQPQVGILCLGAIEKRPKVITGAGRRGHDRHSHLRVLLAVVRSPHRRRRRRRQVHVARQEGPRDVSRSGALTMPRALTIQRTLVTPPRPRASFTRGCERKQEYYAQGEVPLLGVRGSGPAGRVPRVLRGRRCRRRWRARMPARPSRVLDPNRVYTEVELPIDADTHASPLDGKSWLVFPSGRVTQYDRDEFALVFVHGTGADREVRVTRYSPVGRAVARAVARRAERRGSRSGCSATRSRATRRPKPTTRRDAPLRRGGGGPFVDLHMHSTASDGSRAPARRRARGEARRALARSRSPITTRSTASPRRRRSARELGVRVVAGVELSAVEGDVETHILGLHLARHARARGASSSRCARCARVARERIVARLERARRADRRSRPCSSRPAGGAIGRPHVARAMIAEGWAVDFRDAFDRYLGNGKPAYVGKDRLARASTRSRLIHGAGGLAVLAHPAQSGTRERVEAFVAQGIDGVEVRHPSHSSEDIAAPRARSSSTSRSCRAADRTGMARRKARARSA